MGAAIAIEVGSRQWWLCVFAAIDARDAERFAAFLTDDAEFVFGNAPAVCGRAAIREAVAGFFGMIGGCSHEFHHAWRSGDELACEGRVTYARLDGRSVSVTFANCVTLRGREARSYRIHIDNGPLFAP